MELIDFTPQSMSPREEEEHNLFTELIDTVTEENDNLKKKLSMENKFSSHQHSLIQNKT